MLGIHQLTYVMLKSSHEVQRRTQSVPVPVLHTTIVREPPVVRKSFPESWIFDSLFLDKEYVLDL